jgi:hypothetical protein
MCGSCPGCEGKFTAASAGKHSKAQDLSRKADALRKAFAFGVPVGEDD